jgi:tetratricopeptide (TPR) repeat protein
MEVFQRTLEAEPDLTGVPRDLLPVLWKSLRKDPSERPSLAGVIGTVSTLAPDTTWPAVPSRRTSASRLPGLWAAAGEARERGDINRAAELYAEVWKVAISNEDPGSEMFALYQLGWAAESRLDYGAAHGFYEQALQAAKSVDAASIQALALRELEQLSRMRGDTDAARAYAEEARHVLDKRYKAGYPRLPDGDSEPFVRPWVRG